MDEKELQALYNAVSQKFDIGDYDSFKSRMATPDQRKSFYNTVSGKGIDLGDYSQYESRIVGSQKKSSLSVSSDGKLQSASSGLTQGDIEGIKAYVKGTTTKVRDIDRAKDIQTAVAKQKSNQLVTTNLPKTEMDKNVSELLPSSKDIEQEALNRFTIPHIETEPRMQGLSDQDPIGNKVGQLQFEKDQLKNDNSVNGLKEQAVKDKQIELLKDHSISNGDEGGTILSQLLKTNPDNLTKEQIEQNTPHTLTGQLAKDKYLSLRNVKESLWNTTNFEDAAIDLAIKNGDKGLEQLRNTLGGNTSAIGDATKGEKLFQFLNDKDVQYLAQTNPKVNQEYKETLFNLPAHHPEYAATVVKQLISDKLEQNGDNNWFYNITSKDKADKIVNDAVSSGELSPNYQPFYDKVVRPQLGTWQQLVHGNPISTPGLLENINQGAQNMLYGTGKSIAQLTGVSNLVEDPTKALSKNIEQDYNTPHATPQGLLHKTTTQGGQLIGTIFGLSPGAASLETLGLAKGASNALAFGLGVMGDYNDESKKLFPNNPLNQAIYSNVMTGLNIWGSKFLPGQNILKEEEPNIVNSLKDIISGKVSIDDGKNKIISGLTKSMKGGLGGGEFIGATTAADNILSQTLQGKKIDAGKVAENTFEAAETGFLATSFLGGADQLLRKNKGIQEAMYAMASNPDYFKEVIKNKTPQDQHEDLLKNLDYVSQLKQHLDNETKLNDDQKQKYLAASLRQKILEDNAKAIPDKQLRGNKEKQISDVEIEKSRILNPDMGNKKFIEEMYNNELLPKADMRSLEDEKGKFSEHKVGQYLKEVAQQANNLDANWNVNKTKAPDVSHIPNQVIEAANERWKTEIENALKEKPIGVQAVPNEQNKILPNSENIVPDNSLRTMDMGSKEGQKVTEADKKSLQSNFLKGDVPIDGENGKGETGRQFAGRVISRFEDVKQTEPDNTTIVTHSSTLKAIKAWEDPDTWKGIEKPTDPNNMNDDQWTRYAEAFNKESTENGDLETFKGNNGDINVIRHGETEDNKENKFRSGNTNLTDKGINQAHDVGKELNQKTGGKVPKIISSDLPRAIHSSNIINEELGKNAEEKPALEAKKKEIDQTMKPKLDDLPFLKSEEFDKAKDSNQMEDLNSKQKGIKQQFKNLRKIADCIWAI